MSLDPIRADGFERLGYLYDRESQYKKSIESYEKSIQLDSASFQSFIQLSELYEYQGEFEKALQYAKKAAQRDPNSYRSFSQLGDLYKAKRDYENAIASFRKAISINPTEGLLKLGDLYKEKKEYDLAIEQYKKALELDTTLSMAYYHIGLVHYEKKDYDKAINSFLKVTQYYKGHDLLNGKTRYLKYGSPYITLGTTYFLKGNQQLYALSNAKGYLIQGNLETALSWLEKAAVAGYDISSDSFFNEELKDSEEFKALLKKYPKKN